MAQELGVKVIPINAARQKGLEELSESLFCAEAGVEGEQSVKEEFVNEKIVQRYHRAEAIVNQAVEMAPVADTLTQKLDRIVLNRYLGIPIFLIMMYLIFTVAINVGAVFIAVSYTHLRAHET